MKKQNYLLWKTGFNFLALWLIISVFILWVIGFQKVEALASEDSQEAKFVVTAYSQTDTRQWEQGWVTSDDIEIKAVPAHYSENLVTYQFNDVVQVSLCNDEWLYVKINDSQIGYVEKQSILLSELNFVTYELPNNTGFKSYMPYKAITNKSSQQYALQDLHAYTGDYGIRQVNNRFCIAIGTSFNAAVGTYVDVILENETSIPCIVGDIKAEKHTKGNTMTKHNGCVTEFIVDSAALDRTAKLMGDISYCCDVWNSPVQEIRVYERNILSEGER